MSMLVRLDSDRALELLHSMSMEAPESNGGISPLKMQLAQQVFQVLVERDGASVLPQLEQEAEAMGNEGHCPYAALGYAAMQASSKDWGKDNQLATIQFQDDRSTAIPNGPANNSALAINW